LKTASLGLWARQKFIRGHFPPENFLRPRAYIRAHDLELAIGAITGEPMTGTDDRAELLVCRRVGRAGFAGGKSRGIGAGIGWGAGIGPRAWGSRRGRLTATENALDGQTEPGFVAGLAVQLVELEAGIEIASGNGSLGRTEQVAGLDLLPQLLHLLLLLALLEDIEDAANAGLELAEAHVAIVSEDHLSGSPEAGCRTQRTKTEPTKKTGAGVRKACPKATEPRRACKP
jgi:hypothetical protein